MDKIQALKNAIEFAKQNPDSEQAIQLRRRIESGMYNNELAQIKAQSQPKPDGFIKSIAKDVAGTLLVKPAARATEAATRLLAPNSMAAKGYETMADEGESQNIGGIEVKQLTPENATREITSDALKTASYLFPYGKAAGLASKAVGKIGGAVASGATGGYIADVGYGLADESQTVGQALTPGLGTALGTAIPLAGPATRATGRALQKVGGKTVESVIPISTREAGILQAYKAKKPFLTRVGEILAGTEKAPTTAGKTVLTKGLMGTKSGIGVQAKRASGELWDNLIGPELKANQNAVDLDGFFAKIQDDIIKSTPEKSRQKALLNALESFKKDYSGTKAVSLEGLQKLKEGWAEFIPEKAYRGENISGSANQVRKLLAGEARQTIYDQLGPQVKQAYFDYGNLQGLQKLGQTAMTGQKLKGGAGSFVSELFNRAVTPIATVGGQGVYQLGKGIEFIGNLGAKNLGQALGITKFPGDAMVDDLSARGKKLKNTPNKQGGFVKIGQDANLPTKMQTTQTPKMINKTVISPNSTTKTLKGKGTIPENSLISEAKKYKSAEEFVKAQGETVYHGSNQEIKVFKDMGGREGGVYLTPSKKIAQTFAGKEGKITEAYINPQKIWKTKYKIGDYLGQPGSNVKFGDELVEGPQNYKYIIDGLKKEGYDAIKSSDGKQILILKPELIKTRSQLLEIWNKSRYNK